MLIVKAGVQFGDVGMVEEHVELNLPNHVLHHSQLPHLPFLQHLQSADETTSFLHCPVYLAVRSLAQLAQYVKVIDSCAICYCILLYYSIQLMFKWL